MSAEDQYIYRVDIVPMGGACAFVGLCAEFPELKWFANSHARALTGIAGMVRAELANTESPPLPICEQEYNGNVQFTLPRHTHKRLAIEAAQRGVSLNELLRFKLDLGEKFQAT